MTCGPLLKRDRDQLGTAQRCHLAEFAGLCQRVGVGTEAGGEDPVGGGGGASPLHMAEHRHPGLIASLRLQLGRQRGTDPAEPRVAVLVGLIDRLDQPLLAARKGQLRPLGDDDDREVLAAIVAAQHSGSQILDRRRHLGDDDSVGAAREPRVGGDPAGVAAHHLDHHHPVMGLRGGVEAVDCVGGDLHGGVEAEGEVGAADIVVDRLRNADQRQAVVGIEAVGDRHGVLAADRDDGVQLLALERPFHPVDRAFANRLEAGGTEDRPAQVEDAGDGAHVKRHVVALDQPAVAAAYAYRFVAVVHRRARDSTDRGV